MPKRCLVCLKWEEDETTWKHNSVHAWNTLFSAFLFIFYPFALTPTNGGLVSPLCVCLCRCVEIVSGTFGIIWNRREFGGGRCCCCCPLLTVFQFAAAESFTPDSRQRGPPLPARAAQRPRFSVWSIFRWSRERKSSRAVSHFGAVIEVYRTPLLRRVVLLQLS